MSRWGVKVLGDVKKATVKKKSSVTVLIPVGYCDEIGYSKFSHLALPIIGNDTGWLSVSSSF